ncbi:MAG: patatin-like protein [Syntrophobacteraceae bacterium]
MGPVDRFEDYGGAESGIREIRVALVLYGGVSLAVYENGVTNAFFDLVKGKGIFDLTLKLLDATAVVDVIAGSSAGGINGLLLATALSAGSDFTQTANLWREHGDLGKLMRPVSEAEFAESLFDGEGYYQKQLKEAFRILLTKGNSEEKSTSEMDVFITGTDLLGHVKTSWDDLGREIEDKNHRVVFQLKYRPGRRRLGLTSIEEKHRDDDSKSAAAVEQKLIEKQAAILASIARITSTFPAAFPPFRLSQIDQAHREDVQFALEDCGGLSAFRNVTHTYVDGGVLDNKPFGPVLRAIFYRMPYGLVERKLFYVEPDPQHISQLTENEQETRTNPIGAVVASLTTIPSYQSISEDLDRLKEHNARVGWLKNLKLELAKHAENDPQSLSSATHGFLQSAYRRTRIDSLTRSLLLEVEAMPSAGDCMIHPRQQRLYESLLAFLTEVGDTPRGMANITRYDIDYHLRRAFHLLYRMYGSLEEGKGETEKTRIAMQATSRIIKLLKLVRDLLFMFRDRTVPACVRSGPVTPQAILDLFVRFLSADAPYWQAITEELRKDVTVEALSMKHEGPLASPMLSTAAQTARTAIDMHASAAAEGRLACDAASEAKNEGETSLSLETPTILDVVEKVFKKVVSEWCGKDDCFTEFQALDQVFFPLEFACGIHELDEVELVRISPKDAQTGLSDLASEKKVTGDELAHFAAFFRRDWRSNDILWGRLDGICRIIESLLDKEAYKRILLRKQNIKGLVTPEYLDSILSDCPKDVRNDLECAWERFSGALDGNSENACEKAFEELKKNLILAGQHEAVNKNLRGLYEDVFSQEISWGTCKDEKSVTQAAGPDAVSAAAKILAGKVMQEVQEGNPGETFKERAMGTQTVAGQNGRVPMNILGEYAAQAYLLLWGMLQTTLGGRKRKVHFLGEGKFRLFFRSPVLFTYNFIRTMRMEKRLFPVLLGLLCMALLASGITGIFLGNLWFTIPFVLSFVIIAVYNRLR